TTLSLPEVLTLPPTPRRSIKHRNYKTNFHPVLTAGERTEAIRQKKEQKEKEEQLRKRKAEERREAKEKREEAKRARL
ncbi:AGAP012904-PA, partial [Anopheles gambiae str. PEST]|uniref:Uncharacterized protein n=2 Tax=gambiae species complex TaxID=44542 RepID=A0A6E8W9E4_ANOCL